MRLLLTPDPAALGRRNRLSTFTFFVLAAAGGSGASVVAGLLACWALISLVLRRFALRLTASDWIVVAASLLFFAIMSFSNLHHEHPSRGLLRVGALLPFVMPLVLIPRMRLSQFRDTLPVASAGMAVGGCLLLVIVLAEFFFFSARVQGFAGNQGPLSVTALLCAGWSILHLSRESSRLQLSLAVMGALGGSVAVFLSGMRGTWPLLPICLAIAVFTRRRELAALWRTWSPVARGLLAALTVAVLAGVAVLVAPMVGARIGEMWGELALILADVDTPTSLNLRKEMYSAAVQAIAARPWFGYGAQNHWAAVSPYLDASVFGGISFTHFHNVFLTVGVDAGLVGIAGFLAVVVSPLIVAWRARHAVGGGRRLGASLILVVAFLGAGMTNIMFFHDILDAVWVFSVSLLAASVPARSWLDGVGGTKGN
jgi:O-antigen ligase